MIFQKPVLKNKSHDIVDVLGYTLFVVIFSSYATYGVCAVFGVMGGRGEITVLDVFNGFAAIATASAFFLALTQYRKSIKQQRQQVVMAEAKAQIEKMISVASQIKTGNESSLDNLDKSLGLLSNIAISFYELYKSMDEDIYRAILRMQWQDMYYNYLSRCLKELDLISIIKKEEIIDHIGLDKVFNQAKEDVYREGIIECFREFVVYKKIIENKYIKSEIDLKSKLKNLDPFVMYYINAHHTNDLMYGLISIIDIRVHAPLLAAVGPSDFAFENSE